MFPLLTERNSLLYEVNEEIRRATTNFAPFTNAHEGYAILLEEVDELWDLVKLNPKKIEGGDQARRARMREEAIQIAAMAIRFVEDCCGPVVGQERWTNCPHGGPQP